MKKLFNGLLVVGLLLSVSACGTSDKKSDDKVITVGASSSPHAIILKACEKQLKEEGYTLKVQEFDDYILPNTALDTGDLDANYFQHLPYLEGFNKDKKLNLVSAGAIHFEPLGIYGKEVGEKNPNLSIDDVKEGAIIVVPDDATNEARALQLLAAHGIIGLKQDAGLKATKNDIVSNPKNVEIKEIKAAGIPVTLDAVDFAVINGNYALSGKVTEHVLCTEDRDSEGATTFANVVAVRKGEEKSAKTKALIKALTSKETKTFIEKEFGDLVIPAFE